jgi:hypothetical protein
MRRFRTLTGVLEALGGIGSIVGLYFREIYLVSTCGLFFLMFFGIIVRLKIKDEFMKILPAIVLLLINAYLFLKTI